MGEPTGATTAIGLRLVEPAWQGAFYTLLWLAALGSVAALARLEPLQPGGFLASGARCPIARCCQWPDGVSHQTPHLCLPVRCWRRWRGRCLLRTRVRCSLGVVGVNLAGRVAGRCSGRAPAVGSVVGALVLAERGPVGAQFCTGVGAGPGGDGHHGDRPSGLLGWRSRKQASATAAPEVAR